MGYKATVTISRALILAAVLLLILTAGCGEEDGGGSAQPTAERLPTEAQSYIDRSKSELATRLEVAAADIDLESISTPADSNGEYIVKLLVNGTIYEYRWSNDELVTTSEYPAPSEE